MKKQTIMSEKINHSAAHVLAQAVKKIYPTSKLAIGPAIENGFYYDFEFEKPISENDFPAIEKEMARIIKAGLSFKKRFVDIKKARAIFQEEPYKLAIINELVQEGEKKLSVFATGKDFEDLCRGPHISSTHKIKAFKLTSVAGAYWRGSEKNKMLTRIYGCAFANPDDLEKYLQLTEEAKSRDHRKIGKELDLFSIDNYVGPGLVLWHPKLSFVREQIELYWRQEHRKRGYQYVYTPHLGLSHLWESSGHLDFFKDNMYPPMNMETKDKDEKASYFIKPMSCPFHIRIYNSRPHSYKELPIRWCELGSVYRYEDSGVLHGMFRVRGFTQDDAHIICREDQFISEVNSVLDFALEINKTFGFSQLNVYLSVRDKKNRQTKYVGEERIWQLAEETLEKILAERGIKFQKDIGGAKFYGPAIDLKAVDCMGREWQGTTIQLDMNLPSRLGMSYIGQDGKSHIPIMLHRTLLGSMERFVGTLIEHYGGAFPVWLSPLQIRVLPITEKQSQYAEKIVEKLSDRGLRTDLDNSNQTLSYRVRQGQLEKLPFQLIVGKTEEEAGLITVRQRDGIDFKMKKLEWFAKKVEKLSEERSLGLIQP